MIVSTILDKARINNIRLSVAGDKLQIVAPKGVLVKGILDEINLYDKEIIEVLSGLPAQGNDPASLFKREWQRLSNRISRIMNADRDRGYLSWTRQHNQNLWKLIEGSRVSWDANERLESLKSGRTAWKDYRRLMLLWAKFHVKAIKCHRRARS